MVHTCSLLAQLDPKAGDPEANVERAAEVIVARDDVDLVVFPELFLSGYALDGLADLTTDVHGPELAMISEAAAASKTAVLVGFAEPTTAGVANSAACFDRRGQLAGVYRKLFLFGKEAEVFVAGEEVAVVELDGEWVAPMICFDVEFPEVARAAARAGADLLVTLSANMAPYYGDHELHVRARALENRLPHLYANRVGAESGFEFVGGSRSVAPTGETVAEAASPDEELLIAPIAERTGFDENVDYLRFARSLPAARRRYADEPAVREKGVDVAR